MLNLLTTHLGNLVFNMSAYASHVAKLQSKEKIKIVATEDIFSDKGVLIAKSGTEINEKACQSILKFKLLKPLEDSIFIANQLQPKSIFEQIVNTINRDAYLKAINTKLGNAKILQKCCLRLKQYPILLQKLTVLDMEITHIFNQSLMSAYLAYLCAYSQQLNQQYIEEYFLAGIIHDIGLLHIDRYILTKEGALDANEWRKMQSHPIIGYEILKRIPNFPAPVSQAVLEHHENLDGSGYPRGKNIHDLGSLGQLINLLDNVIVIYNKKLNPLKRSLHDVIPIVQINMHSYLAEAVSSIVKILREAPLSPVEQSDVHVLKDLIQYVQQQQTYINTIIEHISATNTNISFTHNNKDLYGIQNIGINVLAIITSAGLNDEANLNWLEQFDQNENASALYNEVEETRLIQEEIIYQLQSYQKSANVFVNQNPDNTFAKTLLNVLDTFEQTQRPAASNELTQHWNKF